MFIYYGKTFKASQAGERVVSVTCENCGCQYYYELIRIGSGASTASYGLGTASASRKAQAQSERDMQRRLALEADLVPCPKCNWINDELVRGYRLGRYRGVGKAAFALGLAGSILSLVVAWFIAIGSPMDRWLLPYLLVGGPGGFVSLAITMILLRSRLRRRIRPNARFPQKPLLPPGSPPALVLDEATQRLRIATPPATVDGILDFQFGRQKLPNLCCGCLHPASSVYGYPIRATRLVSFRVPLCSECTSRIKRANGYLSSIAAAVGLLDSSSARP